MKLMNDDIGQYEKNKDDVLVMGQCHCLCVFSMLMLFKHPAKNPGSMLTVQ